MQQEAAVKVKHDTFEAERIAREAAQVLVSAAERDVAPLPQQTEDLSRRDFWKLRQDISAVTVQFPSYKESCEAFGLDPDPSKTESHVLYDHQRKNRAAICPKPWQVMGANWQLQQEDTVLGGGIVSLDCGMGKTSEQLLLVHQRAKRVQEHYASTGKLLDCRPTLVVGPPSTVDVWYEEWRRYWRGTVRLLIFYGRDKDDMAAGKAAITLPSNAAEAHAAICKTFPPGDPHSANGVVISAYESFSDRTLVSVPREDEEKWRGMAADWTNDAGGECLRREWIQSL